MAEDVTKSPVYNLSLCSLENFHTSFLTWVGNEYGKEFTKVFSQKEYPINCNFEYKQQEKYGKDSILDLRISIENAGKTEYIVIENKLKSFPTDEQLKKYMKYFENVADEDKNFILLSLAPTLDLPTKWEYMSYSDLAEKMQNIFNDNFKYKKDYHKYLIKDYINVIKHISEKFPQQTSMVYDLYEKIDLGNLEDIYKKYRISQLKNYICQNTKIPFCTVDTDFRNKQGIINVWHDIIDSNLTFLIQIQKNEYRYCMIYGKENDNEFRENIATKLAENNIWFKNCIDYYPRAKNYKSKKFCGYNPNFIYRYQTLNKLFNKKCISEVTYKEIADKLDKDVSELIKNEQKISDIIRTIN